VRRVKGYVQTLIVVVALFGAIAGPAQANCRGANRVPSAGAPTGPFAVSVLCVLNHERAKYGLRRLVMKPTLVQAATGHSQAMDAQGFFSHVSQDGESFVDRINATGYRFRAVGENIGAGSNKLGTPRALVAGWMHSPPHRANILSRRFRQIGVGVAWGMPFGVDPHGVAVTTDFGRARH
jgi:uncharacterized protein YkwD